MANLNSLPNKSIALMDREELISHILRIRNARRGPPKVVKATNPKTRQKSEAKSGKDLVGMLSPEQAAQILAALGEMKEDESEEDYEDN
jgi:hypothetical protein